MKSQLRFFIIWGALTIAVELFSLGAVILLFFTPLISLEALTGLEFGAGMMMFLYLLWSILIDPSAERKWLLFGWGTSLLAASIGILALSGEIKAYSIVPFLILIAFILVFISTGLTARGISKKTNGILYLLATIIPPVYLSICSYLSLNWDTPPSVLIPDAIAFPLFSAFIIIDLICYRAVLNKTTA